VVGVITAQHSPEKSLGSILESIGFTAARRSTTRVVRIETVGERTRSLEFWHFKARGTNIDEPGAAVGNFAPD
jgi:hypothetical protein